MFISDLQLGTHHCGNYLVRSTAPPNRMTAVMAIIVDEREGPVMLQAYQQDDKNVRPATSVIKQNNAFLVKEPYFKVIVDGDYRLHIYNVSNLVCIETHDERLRKKWSPRVFDTSKTADG